MHSRVFFFENLQWILWFFPINKGVWRVCEYFNIYILLRPATFIFLSTFKNKDFFICSKSSSPFCIHLISIDSPLYGTKQEDRTVIEGMNDQLWFQNRFHSLRSPVSLFFSFIFYLFFFDWIGWCSTTQNEWPAIGLDNSQVWR